MHSALCAPTQSRILINYLVSSYLSRISERSASIDNPKLSIVPESQFERINYLPLPIIKANIMKITIGIFDSDMRSTLASIIEVLRDGNVCLLQFFFGGLIWAVKSIPARKSLLNYIQELVGTLELEHRVKIIEVLAQLEIDGYFGPEWLELFQSIVLASPGISSVVSNPSSKGLTGTGSKPLPETWDSLLAQLYYTLCHRLARVKEVGAIVIALRCMSLLLEKKVGKGRNDMKNHADSHGEALHYLAMAHRQHTSNYLQNVVLHRICGPRDTGRDDIFKPLQAVQ